MSTRRLKHPHDRMGLQEFLTTAAMSKPTYYRKHNKVSEFRDAVDLRHDPATDANSMDREKALTWIAAYLAEWRGRLTKGTNSRARSLYKTCQQCGTENHVRRSSCQACGEQHWKAA
jgi:hypothetical protein